MRQAILALLLVASAANGSDQPPIPNLATYKTRAVTGGTWACAHYVQGNVTFGTYYDGAWAMEGTRAQVVADGGDPAPWNACVDIANDVYRDAYVLRPDLVGTVPGYNEFSTGMKLHFQRTGEIESRKGPAYMAGYHLIDLVGRGAAYCGAGGGSDYNTTNVERNRELSYCLRSMLDSIELGVTITPVGKLELVKNNILSQINQQIIAGTYRSSTASGIPVACHGKVYVQPFMLAIQASSLIQYYEATGRSQTNVYDAVKFITDWLWSGQGGQGVRIGTTNVLFYENCIDNLADNTWNLAMPAGNPPSVVDISLFFPHIYQWLYMTPGPACGDVAYRAHADAIFGTAVGTGMAWMDISGKHYNQNMTYSREYVRLRSLPEPTCSAPGTPAVPGQASITVEVNP